MGPSILGIGHTFASLSWNGPGYGALGTGIASLAIVLLALWAYKKRSVFDFALWFLAFCLGLATAILVSVSADEAQERVARSERAASQTACYELLAGARSALGDGRAPSETTAAVEQGLSGDGPASKSLRAAVVDLGCPPQHLLDTHFADWELEVSASDLAKKLVAGDVISDFNIQPVASEPSPAVGEVAEAIIGRVPGWHPPQ